MPRVLRKGSALFNITGAHRIIGRLNTAVLERSLNRVVERHDALRTTFAAVGGIAHQVIAPALTVEPERLDVSGYPPAQRLEQARTLLARARTLRPDDEACRRVLAQLEATTAKGGKPETVLKAYRDERVSKSRTHARLLEHDLFAAQQAMAAGKHRIAREAAGRVLAGVEYVTDAAKAADLRTKAQAIASTAQKATLGERVEQPVGIDHPEKTWSGLTGSQARHIHKLSFNASLI